VPPQSAPTPTPPGFVNSGPKQHLKVSVRQIPHRLRQIRGKTVRREGRPGTASDALAASLAAENKSGVWLLNVSAGHGERIEASDSLGNSAAGLFCHKTSPYRI
jgi:hypothetical protein